MKLLLILTLLSTITGCARERYIVDTKGKNMESYQQDLAECKSYTEQIDTSADAASDAASGAVVGALIGAIVGGERGAVRGAGVGAVSGGTRGAVKAEREKDKVVKNCLRNRGYTILN
ncbi:glycine zipper domain-containing protein [Paraferrimonas sp. SM1919]|uniref:glycine zipper domain-containing protein n=1 Tax=Paraferrimonas sp. SM1919 TaxID=2662263 RepID=UPI0013D31D12|nr:glycine zipper domain-containing protein [Paraferrimonas sp. SM1919]